MTAEKHGQSSVLITGASRGIGLEFASQYAQRGWRVHACVRDVSAAKPAKLEGDVHVHKLDVTDWNGIVALARDLKGEPIDVLLSNAGMIGRTPTEVATIDPQLWMETMKLNALAPMKLAQAFVDHVARSTLRRMVAITTAKASIQLSGSADYTYRASKAALNAGWRSLSMDLQPRGISFILFHPGWVQTDMGGPNAPVPVQDSIAGMIRVIEEPRNETTAVFRNYDGEPLPW